MMFKKTVAALVLGFGVVTSSSAMATAYTHDVTIGNVGSSYQYVSAYQYDADTTFNDIYRFTVTEPIRAVAYVNDVVLTFSGTTFSNIEDFSVNLYGDSWNYNLDESADSTADSKVASGLIAPGQYSLIVSGRTAAVGGMYTFAAATAPVPEPESYAMLLAGLGLMGTIARRRSKAR